jgi:hypothetical protein
MANGKGSLDCCYCIHFDATGVADGWQQARLCKFHQKVLPVPTAHCNRICCHFEPNSAYFEDNPAWPLVPVACRFALFGMDLDPGVLYEFSYTDPSGAKPIAVLRIPNYKTMTWQEPKS